MSNTGYIRHAFAGAVVQGMACLALASPLLLTPGWATAAVQAEQDFDIAPGPLAGALNQFGQSAHILLSYPAQLTDGKASPGVSGRHAVDVGLALLLQGTGLHAVRQANGNYLIEVPATAGAL